MDLNDVLFDDDVLGGSGDLSFSFGLEMMDDDDFLALPAFDFAAQPPLAEPAEPATGFLALPAALLERICRYLEWADLQRVQQTGKRNRLRRAAEDALVDICCNSWRILRAPAAAFDVRVRSSMLSSVDRLRRGEISAKVHQADLRVLVARNSQMEPATKMARFDPSVGQEAAVARIIAIMYQSLAAAVKGGQRLLDEIEEAQRTDCRGMSPHISHCISELRRLCAGALRATALYRKKVVLPAAHVCELRKFEQAFGQYAAQVEALQRGWMFALDAAKFAEQQEQPPCALILHQQQYGAVLRPGQLQLTLNARLYLAPAFAPRAVSACELVCREDGADGDEELNVLSGHKGALDESKCVQFKGFKFTKPSRQKLVTLSAQATVTGPNGSKYDMTSHPGSPILVYSHQKQLLASYETLLRHYVFQGGRKQAVSWPRFVNTLQDVFTSQIVNPPTADNSAVAGLTTSDLAFIRTKFFGSGSVRADLMDDFFSFIGPFFFSLALHRDYINLWEEGYLAGFIQRDDVDLRPYGPGAFLLRYSTGAPGEVVISFCGSRGDSTKHYLIREGDVAPRTRQMLAAFLWRTPNLKTMLRLARINNEYSAGARLIGAPKEEVLRQWIPSDAIPNTFHGYDQCN